MIGTAPNSPRPGIISCGLTNIWSAQTRAAGPVSRSPICRRWFSSEDEGWAIDFPIRRHGKVGSATAEEGVADPVEVGFEGEEAIAAYESCQPDVTLMDLRLPGLSGAEAIAGICRLQPDARILVLSSFAGDEDIHRSLQAGALGYLLKDMLRKELVEAIRCVNARQTFLPQVVQDRLRERLLHQPLTPRETEVVGLIAQGYGNRDIAHRIGAHRSQHRRTQPQAARADADIGGAAAHVGGEALDLNEWRPHVVGVQVDRGAPHGQDIVVVRLGGGGHRLHLISG